MIPSHLLPPGPRVHLAPDGACGEGVGPDSSGCFPDFDLCRGTVALSLLSLVEGTAHRWTTDLMAGSILVGFGIQTVSSTETRRRLSPRVQALLCAIHPPAEAWCPGA